MPRHVIQVRRWGCSQAAVIPSFMARQLKWRVGQLLHIQVENGCVVLRPMDLPKGAVSSEASESVTDGDNPVI